MTTTESGAPRCPSVSPDDPLSRCVLGEGHAESQMCAAGTLRWWRLEGRTPRPSWLNILGAWAVSSDAAPLDFGGAEVPERVRALLSAAFGNALQPLIGTRVRVEYGPVGLGLERRVAMPTLGGVLCDQGGAVQALILAGPTTTILPWHNVLSIRPWDGD